MFGAGIDKDQKFILEKFKGTDAHTVLVDLIKKEQWNLGANALRQDARLESLKGESKVLHEIFSFITTRSES